ncbi:MAG TPA: N-6 DNA methylase [Candidatus Ratteibacteria bacterium]|uniref:site-specific DNA-methyltransferase (adenine-specific) n=1 Tax=candidate division TA06 bacterium ADurb.Bin131 TaxID=1852827 RepID=A0A1V6C5V7_UNCT6|nr:MAG: Type IIS restriction enzyme Eco57I [candidate division TA06 bacterium ADurb.Bin131]HRS06082.1 N-6 DNA methylase [Candidatus Ratteibacteria bacterium]HRV04167.1 N-6 DNA methylase [Candidatus Ratteibacteria bacterium]
MDKNQARQLVKEVFENPFDRNLFYRFTKELLNHFDDAPFIYRGNFIPDAYKEYIHTLGRIGKYEDPDGKRIDILIVKFKKESSLEYARTMQRNFIAWYLNGSRGEQLKDAALVAFVSPNCDDWRFSLVRMDYRFNEQGKVKEEFTPAKRYSFLVGKNETSHTAQSRFLPLIEDDASNPSLGQLEEAFSVEKVTREFFEKYRELYLQVKEILDDLVSKDSAIKNDFEGKNINTVDFSKKLLGQIVFLYFLQKKGWFGVKRNQPWGSGSKHFLRELFQKKCGDYKNFFNDILEPLFYEALRLERPDDYYSKFDCRIPFLNGGLFDPLNNYDWINTDILLPDELFSNNYKTKEGDTGTGILDIFDRYNFTVKEDEPLEKEVAVDPEMLGKVFENLLEVKDRKSKGTYYTPREIVHYMCEQSLINYLTTELEGKVNKEDIETLVKYGETAVEHESRVENYGRQTKTYSYKLPESIRQNARLIDEKLSTIRVCDPAVGSGAFLVGMMGEIIRARNALNPYLKESRTIYDLKRHAIQNCLYGVDIDPGAVDIAKLRLWLSLVVEEEDIKQIKPLPNLDYKIVCGNSLLGVEKNLLNYSLFDKLEELKPLFFNETNARRKQEYKNQINELISQITNGHKDFDFEVYFSEVFHEKGGFDVVIANPPYVDSETMAKMDANSRNKYSLIYKSAKGNWDVFIIFIERGIQILKINGTITYIVPNKLISARYAETLRRILLKKDIKEIRDFSQVDVFKEVDVYPVVFLIQNNTKSASVVMTSMRNIEEINEQNIIPAQTFYEDTDWARYFSSRMILNIILKVSAFPSLSNYCNKISGAATVSEAYEFKKHLKEETTQDKGFKRLVNTGTIDRYLILWGKRKTQYIKSSYLKPIIQDEELGRVSERRLEQANLEKIIIAGMVKELECVYDEGEFLAGKSTTIILGDRQNKLPLKVILSLLNSTLISFWYKHFFRSLALAGGYLRISEREISQIPIPKISQFQQNILIALVDKILAITKDEDYLQNPAKQAKVKEYEKQIDQLVYKLYGLTDEEITIVEGQYNDKKN